MAVLKYEKVPHKFKKNEEVMLPGSRIRGPHYVNQFAYNKTGIIERRGWLNKPTFVKDEKIFGEDGISFHWSEKLVHLPIYFVKGRWYREGVRDYGVGKI